MASKDRSRYFCIDVDEAFEASGEKIINSILARYPTVNYIMVRGQLGWNKKEVNGGYVPTDEFRWKHVWIQRSHNALDKNCVIKNLLKDLPGVEVTKRSLDDTSIANKYTQFVRSWGTFNRSAVHKAPEPENMNKRVCEMTDSEKNDTILQQNQEIERLRKVILDSSVNIKTASASAPDGAPVPVTAPVTAPVIAPVIAPDIAHDIAPVAAPSILTSLPKNLEESDPNGRSKAALINAVRNLSESAKKFIAGKQNYKCANSPGSNNIPGYNCDRWINGKGSFNESGYDIDHIKEIADGGGNENENLQALCPGCHRVKTNASSRIRVTKRKLSKID